jgi:hypothetical protein
MQIGISLLLYMSGYNPKGNPARDKPGILRLRHHLCCFGKFLTRVILIIGIIILGSGIVSCINKTANDQEGEKQVTAKTIEEVLKDHTEELMSLPGVIGTAQGLCNNKPCIKVFVIEKTSELEQKISDNIEGYQVMIEETGEIRALPKK